VRKLLTEAYRFIIRTSAFIGKETIEVLRQTPLILTLVLGPFLIMLLFGIGYRNEARPLRTMIVMQDGDPYQQQVESMATSLGQGVIYQGTTSDRESAMQALRQGSLDMVVVIPPDIPKTLRGNQQVAVQFYHNEMDPSQVSYIGYFGSTYIDEINRRIVRTYAEQGQENASTLEQRLENAHQRVDAMRQALEAGNAAAAQDEQVQLDGEIDAISLLVGGSLGLMSSLDGQMVDGEGAPVSTENQATRDYLTQLQEHNQEVSSIQAGKASYQSELEKLDQLDSDLSNLEAQLEDFQDVEPGVLVAPLRSETVNLQAINIRPVDFYAPAAVVLLLQHLAITFSALAIVREERSGSMELFRISPLSSLEALLGKYLSYLLVGAALAAVITATIVLAIKVPMLGTWVNYALLVLTLLFTALGTGFLLSLFARTELQAVQYAMFILLGSVFFSGFFLDLRYLWEPVRAISWMLPATYAIRLMQSLMLRGDLVDIRLYATLLGIGVLLFILVWFMLRRRIQSEWS